MRFKENLRFYREQAGYKTAKEFSDKLGLPYATYAAYENKDREPKYNTLVKIADELNVSIDILLGRFDNTLGNNNEVLKNMVEDILSKFVPQIIKLNKISDEDIFIDIVDLKGERIDTVRINKGMFIGYFNGIKKIYYKKQIMKMYAHILENSFNISVARIHSDMKAYNFDDKDVNTTDMIRYDSNIMHKLMRILDVKENMNKVKCIYK